MKKNTLCLVLLAFLFTACSELGLLETIEDAKSLSDGNLNNRIFVHSMVQIGNDAYIGSKNLWVKRNGIGNWQKVNVPADTNKTPIVSIATDGTALFVATRANIYILKDGSWSGGTRSGSYFFYALGGVAGGANIVIVAEGSKIFFWDSTSWNEVPGDHNGINGFTSVGTAYYLASGPNLYSRTGTGLNPISTPAAFGGKNITALATLTKKDNTEFLGLLVDGSLWRYDSATFDSEGANSAKNISLVQVGRNAVVGKAQGGYQIYNLDSGSWLGSTTSDGFTDNDSLVNLASGKSLMALSLGQFLYYEHSSDTSRNWLYAATNGSQGLFGAKLKGNRWSWGQE